MLTSSECLVFFLGGMNTGSGTLSGFSKNPVNPFVLTGDSRQGPYYEFNTGRLVDTDGDGMFEYVDPLSGQTVPYHYVSSNNGQGYSKADGALNFYVDSDLSTPLKKDSHQIISPGEDGEFGFVIRPSPFTVGSTTPNYFPDVDFSNRGQESDNITNFGPGGRLEP